MINSKGFVCLVCLFVVLLTTCQSKLPRSLGDDDPDGSHPSDTSQNKPINPSVQEVRIVRFSVNVNTANVNLQDQPENLETDWGVLILPKNYKKDGEPTRLIIYCHGGGGTVSKDESQVESLPICQYLVSLGYAIMDMAGMPQSYSKRLKIDHFRVLGSYIGVRSYSLGYKWILENFNINREGCYLCGGSNGGAISSNLVLHTSIPFIAQAGMSPLLSIEKNAWNLAASASSGGEFSSYQNRANIIRIYGMKDVKTEDELRNARYEKDKVGDYDPLAYLQSHPKYVYPIPFKIWLPVDDPLISIACSREYIDLINQNGGLGILNLLPYGKHSPELVGDIVGSFEYMGNTYPVNQTMYDLAMWFRQNEKKE